MYKLFNRLLTGLIAAKPLPIHTLRLARLTGAHALLQTSECRRARLTFWVGGPLLGFTQEHLPELRFALVEGRAVADLVI